MMKALYFRFVKQDQVVIARLQTAGIICLETFQAFPQMARFTLRDEGIFVCGCVHMHTCIHTCVQLRKGSTLRCASIAAELFQLHAVCFLFLFFLRQNNCDWQSTQASGINRF